MKTINPGAIEKNQPNNNQSQIPCESNSIHLPIFAREPYRTMIQNKQYHKCIVFHRDRLNAIRRVLGGQKVSYSEIRKQLKRFLENYLSQTCNA
jgi:hypothetical protein